MSILGTQPRFTLYSLPGTPTPLNTCMFMPSVFSRGITATCFVSFVVALGLLATPGAFAEPDASLELIQLSKDRTHFVLSRSHAQFTPWGFNYDHDSSGRLLETYWMTEWPAVCRHFQEMKALGANTVRIHLQVSSFMKSPTEPNRESLAQLHRLVALAESNGLYLDITGLGCYDRQDVPAWYNELGEKERWAVQSRFWEAIAVTCRNSPAVFCYDLMNEPVVTEDKMGRDWTPGAFGGRYYVQRLTLDFAGRRPEQIARTWIDQIVAAIRKHDRKRLITVGAIPWALTFPGAKPFFYSKDVGRKLDFVSVHFYPKSGEIEKALSALAVYQVGKPLVIEEMFPLNCSVVELNRFIDGSRTMACGWIGFYWGKSIDEYKQEKKHGPYDDITLEWLEYFVKKAPEIPGPGNATKPR